MSWPLLIGVLAFALALSTTRVFLDPDTYWHLAAGEWILTNGLVPTSDPFSHSMHGVAWVAHEWGSQVLLTVVHRVGGWSALHVLAAGAFASTLTYITHFLQRRMQPVHAVMVVIVAAMLLLTHLLIRPHVLVWLLMAVWVGTLVDAVERGRRPTWWLLAIVVIWANMHLSYVLGVLLAGGIAVDAIVQAKAEDRTIVFRWWALFLVAAIVCLLINPHGWHAIAYTVEVMGMKSLSLVNEWRSADFHEFQPFLIWMLLVFAVALSGRLRLSWPRMLVVLGIMYMALKHQRYHSLVGLVSPFLIASPLAAGLDRPLASRAAVAGRLDQIFEALSRPARISGRLLTAGTVAGLMMLRIVVFPSSPQVQLTPDRALAAVQEARVKGEVLNAYGFGGYLIFQNVPVAIDGRSDMYGDDHMQLHSDGVSLRRKGAIDSLLASPRIGWTLLQPGTPAIEVLDRLPGWRRLYSDSVAVVHVRVAGSPALRARP